MRTTKTKLLALVASAALVAMLGLAACGSSSSTSAASSAASGSASATSAAASTSASSAAASASASASDASVSLEALAEELFQNCLAGTDDTGVLYFYAQGENDATATLMVYDATNNAFAAHSGAYSEPTLGTVKIDTKGAGDAIEFKVAPNADQTAVAFTFDNGKTVNMGPVLDDDTKKMLQELDKLVAEANAASGTEAK